MADKEKRGEKRKCTNLTISAKLELLKKLDSGYSVAKVCEEYGMEKQTVSLSIYICTLAVSPILGGSRQHKRNNKNNGGFTPFFQQWRGTQPSLDGPVSDIRKAREKLRAFAMKFDVNASKGKSGIVHKCKHMKVCSSSLRS